MTLAASAIDPGWVYLHSRLGVPHQRCEITDLSAISGGKPAIVSPTGAMVASGSSMAAGRLGEWPGLLVCGWFRVVGWRRVGFAAACRAFVGAACRVRARAGGRVGAGDGARPPERRGRGPPPRALQPREPLGREPDRARARRRGARPTGGVAAGGAAGAAPRAGAVAADGGIGSIDGGAAEGAATGAPRPAVAARRMATAVLPTRPRHPRRRSTGRRRMRASA